MVTGCPGVTWSSATRRLPSALWNSKARLTGTSWRKRYCVHGEGSQGRPARRPQSARLTVSTARRPAVSPKIDAKTRPKARRSFGRPSCLAGPNAAARSWAPSCRREGMKQKPPALGVGSPRGRRAVTSCSLSWRVTTRGRGAQAPSRTAIVSWARSRAGGVVWVSRCFWTGQRRPGPAQRVWRCRGSPAR